MTSLEDIQNNHIGFGWYMRRCADSVQLAEFYGGVIRLPLIRGRHPVWFFWAGETHIFELKSDVEPPAKRDSDPMTAPCTPVFRCHQPDQILNALEAASAPILSDEATPFGREITALDPEKQLMIFRQQSRGLNAPGNTAAWQRFDDEETFNPGCSPMPSTVQEIGWMVRRVSNVKSAVDFYRDIIGFHYVGMVEDRAVFDLKNGVFLELAAGGVMRKPPSTREEETNTWVHRVRSHGLLNSWFKSNDVPLVNDHIQFNSAELSYCADPDGGITGFEERYQPDRFKVPRRAFLEDVEAERRAETAQS